MHLKNALALFLVISLNGAVTAGSAPADPKAKSKSKSSSNSNSEPVEVLWDAWYTITVSTDSGKRIPFGYYSDRAERTQGRIRFQNQMWKKEEGFINEESLGAFAVDNEALTPLFFNFRSAYRDSETVIDGTVMEGRKLSVRAKRGGQEIPLIRLTLSKDAMFSSHFPIWLQRRSKNLKADRWVPFTSILEDNLEVKFNPVPGRVRLEKEDATGKRLKARRLTIHYRDQNSTWYVDETGVPIRIEITSQKAIVERVTEIQAKKFLEDPTQSE